MEFRPINLAHESVAHYFDDHNDGVLNLLGFRRRIWFGNASPLLGLEGDSSPEYLVNILEGNVPFGMVSVSEDIRKGKFIIGYELTFTAPKSVSILSLVGNDFRLFDEHNKAIDIVLDELAVLLATLVKPLSFPSAKRSFSMVGALFNHDTTPELDPDLHTHVVISQVGRLDDEWISLSSDRLDFINDIKDFFPFLSELYSNVLRRSVEALGYQISSKDQCADKEGPIS